MCPDVPEARTVRQEFDERRLNGLLTNPGPVVLLVLRVDEKRQALRLADRTTTEVRREGTKRLSNGREIREGSRSLPNRRARLLGVLSSRRVSALTQCSFARPRESFAAGAAGRPPATKSSRRDSRA